MSTLPYRRLLAGPTLRSVLLIGVLVRVPIASVGLVLTLHVVGMGRSYGEAGLLTLVMTAAVAISGPWRGRLLDRQGLRRVVVPSLVVLAACWAVAPRLDYSALLAVVALVGLFTVPSFSILRQAVIAAVPPEDRRTALALDAVAVELSFALGPPLGVWAVGRWATTEVLLGVGVATVLGGVLLWWYDPPLAGEEDEGAGDEVDATRSWFTPQVAAIMLAAAAATLILSGTDLALVAAMRSLDAPGALGWVLAVWCGGSIVGGLVYGALRRGSSAFGLLFGLGAVTLPLTWAGSVSAVAVLAVVAGLFCAPVMTAMVDQLSRVVPEGRRGEAMGWHGSFLQVGSALGAPLAGLAIDARGYGAGFAVVAVLGMLVAILGMAAVRVRRRRRVESPPQEPAHVVQSTV